MIGMRRALVGFGLLGSLVLSLPGTAQAAGTWRKAPLPFLWNNNEVSDLAATGPDSVWMAGYQGRFCIPNPVPTLPCLFLNPGNAVVRRWNGSRWLEYPLNGVQGGYGVVTQVEASGSEVWIRNNDGLLGRFDGKAFQNVPTHDGTHAGTLAVNPAGVWIRSGRYRWNGSGWTATPMPDGYGPDGPTGITARVPGEAWANGYRDGVYLLMRWDGTEWRIEDEFPSVGASSVVQDIEVVGPGEVWAVLDDYANRQAPSRIFRYKNGAWTEQQPPTGAGSISALAIDGQGSMLAYRIGGGELVLLKHDGTTWQRQPLLAGNPLLDLTAVPGTDHLWSLDNGWPATVYTNS